MNCSPHISNFLEEISSLSHSIVFICSFPLITEEGFLISPCYSLDSAFKQEYLSFSPLPFASLLFTAICKASSDSCFAFLHFFSMSPWKRSLIPDLEPVCCSMSSSNCCFLTCIQISQEADQVVWYSHLFRNFPVYCDPQVNVDRMWTMWAECGQCGQNVVHWRREWQTTSVFLPWEPHELFEKAKW